ncbi:MAG: histidine kinase [Myxococcota bacterium]
MRTTAPNAAQDSTSPSSTAPPKRPKLASAVSWSPLRDGRFWLAQTGGWLAVHYLSFGDRLMISYGLGAPLGSLAIILAISLSTTLVASTVLAALLARLHADAVASGQRFPVVRAMGLAVLCSLPCSISMHVGFAAVGFPAEYGPNMPVVLTIDYAALMLGWTTLFVLAVLNDGLRRTREQMLETERLAHEAQLRALRARIHPHFLFNSLNSVIGLVGRDPDRARQMLRDVSSLLRRSLASLRSEGVTLRDELDFVESYLRCEATRFASRLQVQVSVPRGLDGHPVPSMLLQPLVENAIKHGMVGRMPLRIEVAGELRDGLLELEVRNTGALIPRSRSGSETGAGGTGLRLVRERLAARYPRSGRFALLEEAGWVCARVHYNPDECVSAPDPRHETRLRLVG